MYTKTMVIGFEYNECVKFSFNNIHILISLHTKNDSERRLHTCILYFYIISNMVSIH